MVAWLAEEAANWLNDRLEPDATLQAALGGAGRVFDTDPPPSTQTRPAPDRFVVFQQQSGLPVVCSGPSRPGEDFVFLVKVVARAKAFSSLAGALTRIEQLLFGADVTVGAFRFVVVELPALSRTVRYSEPSRGGVVYRHAGRMWPLSVYPT